MFISVSQGALTHIGDIVLHHLNIKRYDSESEILDVFKGHNFSIDTEIEKQLLTSGTQLIKFSLTPSELISITLFGYRKDGLIPAQCSVQIFFFIFGWIITAKMTYKGYQKIKLLQNKVESLTFVAQRYYAMNHNYYSLFVSFLFACSFLLFFRLMLNQRILEQW